MKYKKGDNVIVTTGSDRGKTGKVIKLAGEKVVIDGVNLKKKHQRPRRQGQQGQVLEVAHPIHISNILLVDPKSKQPSRVGYKNEGEKKIRISKKSGQEV